MNSRPKQDHLMETSLPSRPHFRLSTVESALEREARFCRDELAATHSRYLIRLRFRVFATVVTIVGLWSLIALFLPTPYSDSSLPSMTFTLGGLLGYKAGKARANRRKA